MQGVGQAPGAYLVTSRTPKADEIQIKLAQGAKPGEGGELPGYKAPPSPLAKRRRSGAERDVLSVL